MRHSAFTITIAQLNPIVGDVLGNVKAICEAYRDADDRASALVVTPELSVTGYPIEDLANNLDLQAATKSGLDALRQATSNRNAALVVGAPFAEEGEVYNAALVFRHGNLLKLVRKKALPNYGVFDEMRNFEAGTAPSVPFALGDMRIGLLICEDVWQNDVSSELRDNGAELLVAINASPFRPEALHTRIVDVAAKRVAETGLPLLYVNQVGGQDEVVFDGGSFFLDASGRRTLQLPQWEECRIDFNPSQPAAAAISSFPDPMEMLWRAMMLAVKDYVRKNGFTDVVLGLSGGLDSTLAASIAGDALGPENVHCVRLPSRHTADLSNTAAEELCRIWGFDLLTLPIEDIVRATEQTVTPVLPGGLCRLAMENIQARARGHLLMTLSNQFNWLLLSTGNKSEIAVGYCTMYGDMCGGFNPLKDVYKTTAYALAHWRNHHRPDGLLGPAGGVIPESVIERPPSAELSPDQKDSDSLPPYELLDAILVEMVEKRRPPADIVALGYDKATVERIHTMLRRSEYKRRQGAPGPKTSYLALVRDRRMPITNGFTEDMADRVKEYRA